MHQDLCLYICTHTRQSGRANKSKKQGKMKELDKKQNKTTKMGWSEPEVTCKKHPDLNQLQGVCASCLREKLAHLHVPSQATTSLVLLSLGGSSSSSGHHHHKRVGSEMVGSMPYDIVSVGNGLKKSKSITFVPRNSVGGEGKKKGFWSKLLLHLKGYREDVLMHHSRTARASLC